MSDYPKQNITETLTNKINIVCQQTTTVVANLVSIKFSSFGELEEPENKLVAANVPPNQTPSKLF